MAHIKYQTDDFEAQIGKNKKNRQAIFECKNQQSQYYENLVIIFSEYKLD